MLTHAENELLCRVEGDAPMGQLMRRHWLPALMIEEVREADGTPVRVKLLGEELVAFRNTEGRVGIVGEFCPHRRASLVFGRNEECGLRCIYHGWKVDVDGNVVEMASEPAESRLAEKVKHISYPTQEAGGFVWVYMGPAESMPEFQAPAFAPNPTTKVSIVKMHVPTNWAQILEGAIDSAHSSSLHSTDMPPARVESNTVSNDGLWQRPSTDKAPRLQVQLTRYGMRYAAIRRPIFKAATHDYTRITTFIAPITVLIPPNNKYSLVQLSAPMDDTNTMFYFVAWSDGEGIDQEAFRKLCGAQVGIDVDSDFRKFRNVANSFKQDRKAMKLGDYTGIRGIPNQDMAMWETMGPIADRSNERLGASDVAIVQFRRLMLDAVRRFQAGEPAIGTAEQNIAHVKLRSFEGVVPKEINWRTLGASEEELAQYPGQEEAPAHAAD
jgi:phthalate 4,5-dioxygenase oxygenase subunit